MAATNYTPIDDLVTEHRKKKQESLATSSLFKESEPLKISSEKASTEEIIEMEPQIDEEQSVVIEERPQDIELDPELKKAGLQAISSNNYPEYLNIKVPITDDKVMQGLRAPITSSLRWLAALTVYILQQAHIKLKVVHGKTVRILKR